MTKSRRGHNEGSIRYLESKKLYEARYTIGINPDGSIKRKSIYGKKRKDVVVRMHMALASLGKGSYADPSNKCLITWCKEWYELYVEPTIKHNTRNKYIVSINRLKKYDIANMKLKDINIEQLQKHYNELSTIYSFSTIKVTHSLINGALSKAEELNLIIKNVSRNIKLPKTDINKPKKIKALTDEQFNLFMSNLSKRSNYYIFALFISTTGLRPGEAMALNRSDICFSKKNVVVNKTFLRDQRIIQNSTKTLSSNRVVPVPYEMIKLMKLYFLKQKYKENHSPIFQTMTGSRFDIGNIRRQFKIIGNDIGCPWITIHTLRHTYASRLFKEGVNVKIISKLLGHKDVTTTYNIYVHFIDNMVENSVQLLNKDIPKELPEKETYNKNKLSNILSISTP